MSKPITFLQNFIFLILLLPSFSSAFASTISGESKAPAGHASAIASPVASAGTPIRASTSPAAVTGTVAATGTGPGAATGTSSLVAAPSEAVAPNLSVLIPEVSSTPIAFADAKLKAAGLPDSFIHAMHAQYLEKFPDRFDRVSRIVELNVFGFLSHSDYEVQDSPLAQKKIKKYLKDHHQSFKVSRKKYAVSPAAIASLLWVETKYGKTMGTFPMPWVFYSLVLGSHPTFMHAMLDLLPAKLEKGNPKNLTLAAAQQKVIERCKSKAAWALEELLAINQIKADHDFDPFKRKSSFAGAFGICQFIPSTYLKFAVSEFRHAPDLYKHSDAIFSVAHFLVQNEWKEKDPESQATALFSYNRSKDYGAVILKLAREVSAGHSP